MSVNNVTRLLDSKKVAYQVFTLPAEKLGVEETARLLGREAMEVYKTIVVTREKGKPVLVVVPGPHTVDLKLVAKFLGEKKAFLPTEKEAEALTGLQAGGISPLALLNKGFRVVISSEAHIRTEIHISGGERGLNLRMRVDDLAKITNGTFGEISREVA